MICQYKQEKDRLPDCNLPSVEAVPGFEHGDTGLADHCLAAWLHRHKNNSNSISYFFRKSKSDFIIFYDTFFIHLHKSQPAYYNGNDQHVI